MFIGVPTFGDYLVGWGAVISSLHKLLSSLPMLLVFMLYLPC